MFGSITRGNPANGHSAETSPPAAPRPRHDEPSAPPQLALREPPSPPQPSRALAQPRVVGPLEAVLRRPFLTLTPIVLLLAAAAAIGLTREPVYTSQARVNVGRVDVPAYTLQGVVIGNETLAAGYARTISAQPVVDRAARAAKVSPGAAAGNLSASPVPGSTLIRVEAEGASEGEAVRLANGAANGVIAYVGQLGRRQQNSSLLERYRRANARVARLEQRVKTLRASRSSQAQIRNARLDLETAKLQASGLEGEFRSSPGGAAPQSLLQLIAPATSASSDFSSMLQRLGLIGLGAGLLVGIGLALIVSNRRFLRRTRE